MADRENRPNCNLGCVAGLFHGEKETENAIRDLKQAAFSESEIGVATCDHSKRESFSDKVKRAFGKEEHLESAADLEDSLHACGLPEGQAQYFNRAIADGDILITVKAEDERASRAQSILQRAGADIGGDTATLPEATKWAAAGGRRIYLLGEILRVHEERVRRGEVRLH